MNPKTFLLWGGIILVVLGVVGFLGLNLGERVLWFDVYENWTHLVLGIVALLAAYRLGESTQRTLVWIVAVVALVVGIWGFFVAGRPVPNFFGANLENPIDNLLHVVVGIWGILAARGKAAAMKMA